MHAFSIFVFAPVQRNLACFTWKSALEICSLLLLLSLVATLPGAWRYGSVLGLVVLVSVFSDWVSEQFESEASQCGSTFNCLSGSVPEHTLHVVGTLSSPQANN